MIVINRTIFKSIRSRIGFNLELCDLICQKKACHKFPEVERLNHGRGCGARRCLRGRSPRMSLWYLSASSCVFRAGETGLSDLHWTGITNSDFSFYKGCPCHTYPDMEKHLVCLDFTCMVQITKMVVCSQWKCSYVKPNCSEVISCSSVSADSQTQCVGSVPQQNVTGIRWSFHFTILLDQCGHSGYFYGGFVNLQLCCVNRKCHEVT